MCDRAEIDNVLKVLLNNAKEIFGDKLEAVILYGSYARGDYDSDSDIDIMIVVDMDRNNLVNYRKPIYKVAHDVGFENDIVVSPHIQDKETFERFSDVVPFYRNVKREGIYADVGQ